MLEYSLEGAEELLCRNLQTATRNLTELDSDVDFLRDQITTTEVSILLAVVGSMQLRGFHSDERGYGACNLSPTGVFVPLPKKWSLNFHSKTS